MPTSKLSLFFFSALLLSGCGSSSSSSSDGGTSGAGTLAAVPAVTGSVNASAGIVRKSAKFFSLVDSLRNGFQLQALATTGQLLSTFSDITWNGSTSGPFCQAGSELKDLVAQASRVDLVKCYMGNMETNNIITVDYTGTPIYIKFKNSGFGFDPVVKYSISKVNGVIVLMTLSHCFSQATQDGFISFSNTSGTAGFTASSSMTGPGGFTGFMRTLGGGTADSNGNWYGSKNINQTTVLTGGTGASAFTQSSFIKITQTPSQAIMQGYWSGSNAGTANSGTYYTVMQLLGDSKLSTIAAGSGGTKFNFTWGGSNYTASRAWNGDSKAAVAFASSDFESAITSGELLVPSVISATAFTGAEVWDCTAPTGSTFTEVDFSLLSSGAAATGQTACNAKYQFTNQTHVRCDSAAF